MRGIVVALGVSMAVAAGPAVASASVDSVPTPKLSWTGCEDGFQCATASVPLDYDRPAGAKGDHLRDGSIAQSSDRQTAAVAGQVLEQARDRRRG